MELVWLEVDLSHGLLGYLHFRRIVVESSSAVTFNPLAVVVAAIKLTATSCVTNGLPRQFMLTTSLGCQVIAIQLRQAAGDSQAADSRSTGYPADTAIA